MSKFKVGDKVMSLGKGRGGNPRFYPEKGTVGKVVYINSFDKAQPYLVQWPKGSTIMDDCWWAHGDDLAPANNNKIVITTDGLTTLARLYEDNKVVKTAEAKCAPSDTYEFELGACIAVGRLYDYEVSIDGIPVTLISTEPPKPKCFSGKVVCVENSGLRYWTIGKAYTVVDGVIKDDEGEKRCPVTSIDGLCQVTGGLCKFIPFVEG